MNYNYIYIYTYYYIYTYTYDWNYLTTLYQWMKSSRKWTHDLTLTWNVPLLWCVSMYIGSLPHKSTFWGNDVFWLLMDSSPDDISRCVCFQKNGIMLSSRNGNHASYNTAHMHIVTTQKNLIQYWHGIPRRYQLAPTIWWMRNGWCNSRWP